jgi:hypothetical protein
MASSGMLGRVALVRTDVSEKLSASFSRVTNGELGTTLAVTSNRRTLRKNTRTSYDLIFLRSVLRLLVSTNIVPSSPILVTLMMEAMRSSDTSLHTRATRRNIPEDTIPYSQLSSERVQVESIASWPPRPTKPELIRGSEPRTCC